MRVEQTHGDERALGVGQKRFDLVEPGGLERGRPPHTFAVRGHEEFVDGDLHRGGEVERRPPRLAGNRRDDRAARELGIGQAGHFSAEDQRDLAASGVTNRVSRCVAHRAHRACELARPCRVADRQARPRKRGVQRPNHDRLVQQRGRIRGARVGVGVRERSRVDEHESRQTHRSHRARRSADVSRVAGCAEDHSDPVERRGAQGRFRQGTTPMSAAKYVSECA